MKRTALSFFLLFAVTAAAAPQAVQPPQRDPQAVSILSQAIGVAGGASAVSAVQDFSGTGTITYYWAGQRVTGNATVRGLGLSLFRLDAQLPEGTRSWLVTANAGAVQADDGTTQTIQYANSVHFGGLTFPYPRMAAALASPSFSISAAGTTTVNGRQATIVQVQQTFPAASDPSGELSKFSTEDYVIDSQSFALLAVQDTVWSEDGRMRPVTREIDFSDFVTASGLAAPLSVTERIGGQQTWSLQLTSVSFNTGLSASVFQF